MVECVHVRDNTIIITMLFKPENRGSLKPYIVCVCVCAFCE